MREHLTVSNHFSPLVHRCSSLELDDSFVLGWLTDSSINWAGRVAMLHFTHPYIICRLFRWVYKFDWHACLNWQATKFSFFFLGRHSSRWPDACWFQAPNGQPTYQFYSIYAWDPINSPWFSTWSQAVRALPCLTREPMWRSTFIRLDRKREMARMWCDGLSIKLQDP